MESEDEFFEVRWPVLMQMHRKLWSQVTQQIWIWIQNQRGELVPDDILLLAGAIYIEKIRDRIWEVRDEEPKEIV